MKGIYNRQTVQTKSNILSFPRIKFIRRGRNRRVFRERTFQTGSSRLSGRFEEFCWSVALWESFSLSFWRWYSYLSMSEGGYWGKLSGIWS